MRIISKIVGILAQQRENFMIALLIAGLALAGTGFFGYKSYSAQDAVPSIGVVDGKLVACPDKPNCVSSYASDERHKMDAWPLNESPADMMARLNEIFIHYEVEVVSQTTTYVHAVYHSSLFNYPDDVEFYIDAEEKKIHFRSASRVGHSDLGANRKRIQEIKNIVFVVE
jgi:uncharacterized protein (DUF1499 family)